MVGRAFPAAWDKRRQFRGELAISQARRSRGRLVFGRSQWIGTMMQSCASAAKLRGGGPILNCGAKPHVQRRDATASDRHRQALRRGCQADSQSSSSLLLAVMTPDVRQRPEQAAAHGAITTGNDPHPSAHFDVLKPGTDRQRWRRVPRPSGPAHLKCESES
jgi:hypothetical protein